MSTLQTRYPSGERIREEPVVHVVNDMLSAEECALMIETARPLLKRGSVSGAKKGIVIESRTNDVAWVRHDRSPEILAIADRISTFVGLPRQRAEAFQVIRYTIGQEYRPHLDAFDPETERGVRNMKNGGQRMLTVLCYLNEVAGGGETWFPTLQCAVRPALGRMLLFHNCLPGTHTRDSRAIHAGTPVFGGEKWAFNLWYRANDRDQYPRSSTL